MPEASAASTEITADTVAHLAGLARIALTPDEIGALTSDLDSILTHIAKVGEVATPDVPATSHPIPLSNVTRPDVVSDVLTREQALANAPESADGMFRVSSILGEEQ
ncbi:Asp-tRNA(Asn)/Glu-tRNA(Gln) amidotransferase subunit GatC [Leucobacter chromiiresistens]|uniref:Aspartyl/glutamyl-tRNA(Asn/Gln) amidotransferase subunit C n=1 Tax=Leucobacter chromiiresistens TaxID=1079994 RepID=A0A147ELW9_9MICO|nr:Asp-tRNA(Asn)/Glu-tRNA(Gln) amidotransferase subunit GatC [Leucobacter chromiiresistens]KTR85398.1 glutamyl-tRNA amidotransferase [Leucobacter chromiiresistens]